MTTPARPSKNWIESDRLLARRVAQPVARFLHTEAAGGILLLAATVVALVWANSPWKASYADLWHTEFGLRIGEFSISEDLRHWVNDALMALFFFVVGMEIKRELVVGELATLRAAILPAIAAVGGMVVPAALYVILNAGGEGSAGWGIPMATDIAFAAGVMALLGRRAPVGLKVLLLSLAIVDDIGAIVVIAVFYSGGLSLGWLAIAFGGLLLVAALQRAHVWHVPIYAVVGAGVWLATFESGVHATIAGVALGLLTPARPFLAEPEADKIADRLSPETEVTAEEVRVIGFQIRESVSVAERLESLLHPWTGYVIVPIFALANAGVAISAEGIGDAVSSPVTLGIVLGLVVGKVVGVTGATWVACKTGLTPLPAGVTNQHIRGMAALAGIGFTVSLFITGLAFDDPLIQDEAKLGVLAASAIAAVMGTVLLLRAPIQAPDEPAPETAGLPVRDEG